MPTPDALRGELLPQVVQNEADWLLRLDSNQHPPVNRAVPPRRFVRLCSVCWGFRDWRHRRCGCAWVRSCARCLTVSQRQDPLPLSRIYNYRGRSWALSSIQSWDTTRSSHPRLASHAKAVRRSARREGGPTFLTLHRAAVVIMLARAAHRQRARRETTPAARFAELPRLPADRSSHRPRFPPRGAPLRAPP
jgi:hypothetical protein